MVTLKSIYHKYLGITAVVYLVAGLCTLFGPASWLGTQLTQSPDLSIHPHILFGIGYLVVSGFAAATLKFGCRYAWLRTTFITLAIAVSVTYALRNLYFAVGNSISFVPTAFAWIFITLIHALMADFPCDTPPQE